MTPDADRGLRAVLRAREECRPVPPLRIPPSQHGSFFFFIQTERQILPFYELSLETADSFESFSVFDTLLPCKRVGECMLFTETSKCLSVHRSLTLPVSEGSDGGHRW